MSKNTFESVNTNWQAPKLRWNNDDAKNIFTKGRPLSAVVEPNSAADPGLYAQLTKFPEPKAKHRINNKRTVNNVNHGDDDNDDKKAITSRNRAAILLRDHNDRESSLNTNGGTQWRNFVKLQFHRHPSPGSGDLGIQRKSANQRGADLRSNNNVHSEQSRNSNRAGMSAGTEFTREFSMATATNSVKKFARGPLHGSALALYFFLLPYVVISRWNVSRNQSHSSLIHFFLIVLGIFWVIFLLQLLFNIVQLRNGRRTALDGSAWLAGLVMVLMPFLVASSASAASLMAPISLSTNYETPAPRPLKHHDESGDLSLLSSVPLALAAKKRKDSLRSQQATGYVESVDEAIAILRANSPELISSLIERIGDRPDGLLQVTEKIAPGDIQLNCAPLVVTVLLEEQSSTTLAFSHAGGILQVGADWSIEQIMQNCVALHSGGQIMYAHNESELLTALAKRMATSLVIYVGAELRDKELQNFCVQINRSGVQPVQPREIRVELLRAAPTVQGLVEPFSPALRRRCIEMTSYLALHRHEPVTGDRLRTRVLTHEEIDASLRTLSNTASAVRKSLGIGLHGPRLRPVSSSGLYETSEVTSDLEIFHDLVTRARTMTNADGAHLVRKALELVTGEPLASVLRGYEWFLAEGHSARMLRDGEWAALSLHHDALTRGDYEEAFWALEKGRLIDPYSDALNEALNEVPRLREFRSDAGGASKHEPISTSSTVSMSGSLFSLGNQVAE
jgi:hypothetical protein